MVKEARDINPFGLRMPPELRQQLEAAAIASGRSLNAELVSRLQASLGSADDLGDRVRALEEEMRDVRKELRRKR